MNHSIHIPYPPQIDLARLSTPLIELQRLSAEVGFEILCKRDDQTGAVLSGNKVRKLEFLFAEAIDQGADRVITCGGEQSNHARATAVSAARLGLGCHLLLRTKDPTSPPPLSGNILLDRLAGATIEWITAEEYQQRDTLLRATADRIEKEHGGKVYVIPEGGSNALGAWGYVRCAEELYGQLGPIPATIIYPVGSGGTAAGMIAGCSLLNLPYRLIGICVCNDRLTFQQRIAEILDQMAEQYQLDSIRTPPQQIEILEDYVGAGYALSRPEELDCIKRVAQLEGIFTDPVYTGKTIFGLLEELARGVSFQQPIVFLHTGGVFGLFPQAEQIEPLL